MSNFSNYYRCLANTVCGTVTSGRSKSCLFIEDSLSLNINCCPISIILVLLSKSLCRNTILRTASQSSLTQSLCLFLSLQKLVIIMCGLQTGRINMKNEPQIVNSIILFMVVLSVSLKSHTPLPHPFSFLLSLCNPLAVQDTLPQMSRSCSQMKLSCGI